MTLKLFAKVRLCALPWCLLSFTSLTAQAADAQTANLSGRIKDTHGIPVAGVVVTLECRTDQHYEPTLTTQTSASGTYRLSGVRPLRCRLQASASGLQGTLELDLTHHAPGEEVHAKDLTLASVTTVPSMSGLNSKAAPEAPTFEASGIRGLIDPGGYSAPANAAAASGLLSGMADVRRAGSAPPPGAGIPCSAGPAMLLAVYDHSGSPEANRTLGDFYLAHGQPSLALPYLETAHKATPGDTMTVLHLARAEIALEQFAAARTTLAQLPAEVLDVERYVLLAQADEGLGSFTAAAMQYGLAEKQVEGVDNAFGQGYELVLAGRLPEAHNAFEHGLEIFPHSVRLLVGKGSTEYLAGDSAAAVATFLQAVATDPADPEAYPFLAQAYLVSGQHGDQVRLAMNKYLAHADQNGTAYYLQALVLSRQKPTGAPASDAELIILLRRAIQLDPGLALAHFRLGVLLARHDENEAAATQIEEALRLQPDLAEAHFRLSGIYRKLGRSEAAAREMATFKNTHAAGQTEGEEAGVDLRQFISVMRTNKPGSAVVQCH